MMAGKYCLEKKFYIDTGNETAKEPSQKNQQKFWARIKQEQDN